jgi:hypothetical protein
MKLEQKFETVEPNHINYIEGLVESGRWICYCFAKMNCLKILI